MGYFSVAVRRIGVVGIFQKEKRWNIRAQLLHVGIRKRLDWSSLVIWHSNELQDVNIKRMRAGKVGNGKFILCCVLMKNSEHVVFFRRYLLKPLLRPWMFGAGGWFGCLRTKLLELVAGNESETKRRFSMPETHLGVEGEPITLAPHFFNIKPALQQRLREVGRTDVKKKSHRILILLSMHSIRGCFPILTY